MRLDGHVFSFTPNDWSSLRSRRCEPAFTDVKQSGRVHRGDGVAGLEWTGVVVLCSTEPLHAVANLSFLSADAMGGFISQSLSRGPPKSAVER